jgi:hypothetical protein
MILMFFIFSIMGCYLFEDIKFSNYKHRFSVANEFYNFDTFYESFLLVFRCTSGESWPMMMLEYQLVDPNVLAGFVSIAYFIGMIFMCSVIMLNLFVLVVLQQYDEFHQKEENPIERFGEMLESFKKCWNTKTTEDDKGERIKMVHVTEFLMELEGDLSLNIVDPTKKSTKIQEQAIKERLKREITDLKFMTYYYIIKF